MTPTPAFRSPTPELLGRFDLLRRRRIVAAFAALTVFSLAAPFVMGLPKLYRASATVLVEGPPPQGALQTPFSRQTDGRLQAIKLEALSRARLTQLVQQFD